MKTLKLTGNFSRSMELNDSLESIEELERQLEGLECGSQEYYDCLKQIKDGKEAHCKILTSRGK